MPTVLNDGARVVRAYRADGSMNYDANVLLAGGDDVASAADRALDRPDVVEVHVRTAVPQCFLYAVRRA